MTVVPEVVAIVFIVLKLTGVVDWSWLAVLSPLFVAVGLHILIVVGVKVWARLKFGSKEDRRKREA
jgi:uncharacterized membrane protein